MGVRISPPVQKKCLMIDYIKESYQELTNQVTWISINEAQRLMVVVVVFTILFSLLIFGIDSGFEYLIGKYFQMMK